MDADFCQMRANSGCLTVSAQRGYFLVQGYNLAPQVVVDYRFFDNAEHVVVLVSYRQRLNVVFLEKFEHFWNKHVRV